jgi:group II intron reverse transcriptase/maturase
LAYPVGGNNSTVGNNRETIACQAKRVNEDISERRESVQENTPAQGSNMVDTELWNVRSLRQKTVLDYKDSDLRQSCTNLPYKWGGKRILLVQDYPSHWGQGYENTTILEERWYKLTEDNSTIQHLPEKLAYIVPADNGTGEIHSERMEVRGFVVTNLVVTNLAKESKSRFGTSKRAYTKLSNPSNSLQSQMNEDPKDLGFGKIAQLWYFNYQKPTKIFKENLKSTLNCKELWYACYIKIRSNKGSETPGVDQRTLDRTTIDSIDKLRESVMNRTFKWKAIKKVEIPKDNGKTRPLGIPTTNDRLVQEVLRVILEAIYEPTFSKNSHGFRPGRGCHTALKQVNTQFKAVNWYIEGDIKSYFDTINHNILINIIRRKVRDELILSLIESGLKARIIFNGKIIEHISGTPQGGILSPLLSNIYLHELDTFMDNIMDEYQGMKNTPKTNPMYRKYMDKARERNPKLARKYPAAYPFDSDYRYIRYVRYADDFLVGIVGPREIAVEVKNKIGEFLEKSLSLTLSPEKTLITSIAKTIPFLGHKIGRKTILMKQRVGRGRNWVNRKMAIPILDANVEKMILNLSKNGFCDREGNARPNYSLLPLPQSEINHRINSIIRGISHWWAIAGNRRIAVARISFIMRMSAAKLFATKFKLNTSAQVFARGGSDLSRPLSKNKGSVVGVTEDMLSRWKNDKDQSDMKDVLPKKERQITIPGILYHKYKDIPRPLPNKVTSNWEPDFVKSLKNLEGIRKITKLLEEGQIRSNDHNPLAQMGWRFNKGVRVFEENCVICGSSVNIEMHHVKSLKLLKPLNNKFKDRVRALTRKQIPLCRNHHLQIHNGNWRNPAVTIDVFLEGISNKEAMKDES